jgi:2-iminoacetate synthase ThiH
MADVPSAPLHVLRRTVAMARLAFGPVMSVQAPPNLAPDGAASWSARLASGINDWGGASLSSSTSSPIAHNSHLQTTRQRLGGNLQAHAATARRPGEGSFGSPVVCGLSEVKGCGSMGWAECLAGISPVTRDFVNPEAPWPHLSSLAATTAAAGFHLVPRLTVYPRYLLNCSHNHDQMVRSL